MCAYLASVNADASAAAIDTDLLVIIGPPRPVVEDEAIVAPPAGLEALVRSHGSRQQLSRCLSLAPEKPHALPQLFCGQAQGTSTWHAAPSHCLVGRGPDLTIGSLGRVWLEHLPPSPRLLGHCGRAGIPKQ